jgi:AcrR family transcriptional regulator
MTGEGIRGRIDPVPRPTLRTAQRDLTRRRIRAAARKLFTSAPFEQVSMEDIARDAEIGRTTIYLHYPSKSPLLVELLKEDWARQATMFERLTMSGRGGRRMLKTWLRAYAMGLREARDMFRMYTFTLALDAEVSRLHDLHRERLIRLLGRCLPGLVARADARPDQRRAAAASHALIGQLEQYGGLVVRDAPLEDVEAAAEVLLDAMEGFMVPY